MTKPESHVSLVVTAEFAKPTKDVNAKTDEAVVGRQRLQDLVDKNDVSEVVDNTLAIQEVHGGREPVPVQRLCEAQVAGPRAYIGDGDDLLEGDDLDSGDDQDDVDVTGEQSSKETGNHHQGPKCPDHEVGLFLLILRDCRRRSGGSVRRFGVWLG